MKRALLCLALAACSNSHNLDEDAAAVDAATDAATIDAARPDAPDAADVGPLNQSCPAEINPYMEPYVACAPSGATCSESSVCGSALFCDCVEGLWNCSFAHPDPVCTCGREPSEGDPCSEEGASCGECCPTGGAPDWAPMMCIGGTWQALGCPPVECPAAQGSCPVNPHEHIRDDCNQEGLVCGNACCGTAIECNRGTWVAGPDAECLCDPGRACGPGTCRGDQYCVQSCGPADGPEFLCESLPEGCLDCSCIPVDPGFARCEMVDGAPTIVQSCS